MRTIQTMAVAAGLVMALCGFALLAQEKKAESAHSSTSSEVEKQEAKAVKAGSGPQVPGQKEDEPRSVRADNDALELIADFQLIQGEIARIERASGTVEIPVSLADLRARSQAKVARLQGWMKAHGVGDDWRYDAQAKEFTPPPPAKAAAPDKKEGKP